MSNTIYAAYLDMDIKQGDGTIAAVTFTDPNNAGDPLDLTQFANLTMQVKHNQADATNVIELIPPDLLIGGANSNELSIILTSSITDIFPKTYFYDIQGEVAGEARTILEGLLKVAADVTR
jgi:hypothetical protein